MKPAKRFDCPQCGRYLILRGRTFFCFHCLGRADFDPDAVGEWDRNVIENLVR